MAEVAFKAWPKTARLFRDIVITEKIDGSNAAIHVTKDMEVFAQSRRRLVTPESDNYGFASWAHDNSEELAHILGPGQHFGEWWGQGIQRRYGRTGRTFSLFNTKRWYNNDGAGTSQEKRADQSSIPDQIDVVPTLYAGAFSEDVILSALRDLRDEGSYAAPGFMDPEGICIYHTQTRGVFKVTLDNNDAGKWEVIS